MRPTTSSGIWSLVRRILRRLTQSTSILPVQSCRLNSIFRRQSLGIHKFVSFVGMRFRFETMIATARITFDRDYFSLQYDEWLQHRSRFKKYEPIYCVGIVVLGLALVMLYFDKWHMGAVVAAFGAYKLSMSLTSKSRWVNARLRLIPDDKTVQIRFENESIVSDSKNGTSEMLLSAFGGFTIASQGFFLIPENGTSIYVPQRTIDPAESYEELVNLLSASIQNRSR